MKSIIVGTAGHIDHGKTALVKALTGIDADRLKEEKRRGITIDLGFAHLELPGPDGGLRFGFVDVPGHERFIRNMLAGVGGIDLVLLVIAADEGIKPQTREHFDICRLLSVQRGITILTKSDLVDNETLEVVRLELEDFLRGSFLDTAKAPIIPVSALNGTGLDDLKRELVRAGRETPSRDSKAITRLPIDRVFSMKGFGTVVTGTLDAGTIREGDELELFPAAKRVRVRGVQVHGVAAEKAVAGERTALNLAGVEKHELERGMMLASPDLLQTSSRVDVKVSLLASARPLKSGSRVHFHAFTSETIASVTLYEDKQVKPGAEGFAQLRSSAPLCLVRGDRFIIRQFSPVLTIGGGVVLDAMARQKTPLAARLEFLKIQAEGDPGPALLARIARRGPQAITLAQLVAETGHATDHIENLLSEAVRQGVLARRADLLMDRGMLNDMAARLHQLVTDFHHRNPLVAGISRESLREQARLSPEVFEAALAQDAANVGIRFEKTGKGTASSCAETDTQPSSGTTVSRALPGVGAPGDSFSNSKGLAEKKLEIMGELVRLPGRGVMMRDEETESKEIIAQAFASAGLKVPALKDVLAGLKIDKARAQKIMTLLLRERILIKVSDDLVFHQSALAELRKSVAAQKQISPRLDVARFKELTGVSRKYAIPLLEYLDRERVTRRVGDERVIL